MSSRIEVRVVIPASIQEVWDDIARLETHVEWMADARRIDIIGDRTEGAGTRMKVLTRLGPLRTTDVIEFVAWDPPHRMAIRHHGLVRGHGEFLLVEAGARRTTFTWREQIVLPGRLGGRLGAAVVGPVLTAVWRRNLKTLAARFE